MITLDKLKALAQKIMQECQQDGEPVSEDEALEMAKMEIGAKSNRRYEQSDAPRKKSTRERKVDTDKAFLLNLLYNGFEDGVADLGQKQNETGFDLTYNGNTYTVKLIKHRPKK